ncbi:MAG: hypothetical protein ACRD27_09845 [Terracidiphilus sp.]
MQPRTGKRESAEKPSTSGQTGSRRGLLAPENCSSASPQKNVYSSGSIGRLEETGKKRHLLFFLKECVLPITQLEQELQNGDPFSYTFPATPVPLVLTG